MDKEAQDARFYAFLESTDADERDWIAFCQFEDAIHDAALCATMIKVYDKSDKGGRELDNLKLAIGEMLFRVLKRVDLGTLITRAEGIGYAIRYGLVAPSRDALNAIANTEAFEELAAQGYAADQADTARRLADLEARRVPADDEED